MLFYFFVLLATIGIASSADLEERVTKLIEEESQRQYAGARQRWSNGNIPCIIACVVLDVLTSWSGEIEYAQDPAYGVNQLGYWSQQQQLQQPTCRFNPSSPRHVSAAVLVSRGTKCPFAVKSGGHASFYNASNIQGGLAIDLRSLNSIVVSADQNTTSVGSGTRWEEVYAVLDQRYLAVVGGRNGDIGVGGYTLGGGISFLSGYYGWGCDNVRNYEVVLASGEIVNANTTSHPNLFFALRGGGNNFGIVTRFDLMTYPQGDLWGGMTVYDLSKSGPIYDAFYWFNYNSATDPKAALIVAVAYTQKQGYIMSNDYTFVDPVVNPPVFQNFTSIESPYNTSRVTNLTDLTTELKNTQPSGLRQIFITATFRNDAQILKDVLDIFQAHVDPIKDIADFLPSLVYQPIQLAVISKFQKNGGNALGIDGSDGPLTILDINFTWSDPADDDRAQGAAQAITAEAIALAKSRGLYHPYIYQNYAYIKQDVFGGYGAANKKRLLRIQKKYDPGYVFRDLQPGYMSAPPNSP